jgi:hypothetical protein
MQRIHKLRATRHHCAVARQRAPTEVEQENMKRIALFLATNLAIILVLSITLRLLGFERILDQ